MSGTDDPSQVYWSQRNARERAMSETPKGCDCWVCWLVRYLLAIAVGLALTGVVR